MAELGDHDWPQCVFEPVPKKGLLDTHAHRQMWFETSVCGWVGEWLVQVREQAHSVHSAHSAAVTTAPPPQKTLMAHGFRQWTNAPQKCLDERHVHGAR